MPTSVLPPSTTPAGWFGCFATPVSGVAQPVALVAPCGVDSVESCCGFGDECLSNALCKNNGNTQEGVQLYYTSYCTDPTYSEAECNQYCPFEPALYCGTGSEQIWQCSNGTACNLTATTAGSSIFFAPAPTNLLNGTVIATVEPSSVDPQFIPTVWNAPGAPVLTSSTTSGPGTTLSGTTIATGSPNHSNSTTEFVYNSGPPVAKIVVGVAVPVGVIMIAAAIIFLIWRRKRNARRADESTRGVYQFSKPEVSKTDRTYYGPNDLGVSQAAQEIDDSRGRPELPASNQPVELPGSRL
ncbi:hypothetical protein MMC13_003294 [Lambiella insularis]|nr:hypothetical protein [Lambiella insularis]